MAIAETDTEVHARTLKDVAATQRYFDSSRFAGIIRPRPPSRGTAHGTIPVDHIVARRRQAPSTICAETLCSPQSMRFIYSPGQAVSMKRMGSRRSTSVDLATSAPDSSTEVSSHDREARC